ncbi:hypothetical protein MAP_0857c [Mycobacterium avium subsp. paratuberculosis K-10]|uniref:Uncharacterized protein n=1 Tax=Mycolicibacterium paratuberculosis (strain ATCC BAA-968 / K-10) TaxID=262316 RepID=Q742H8_MYCPA|nr:hypothetical protein MAP_0857c [Mycobacterium avium subsp. paratuberculosis K-10]AGL37878.1 hypothetical protein MAP4_3003 [Mycobacterium avium subsp. paratuberculosis MAP4]
MLQCIELRSSFGCVLDAHLPAPLIRAFHSSGRVVDELLDTRTVGNRERQIARLGRRHDHGRFQHQHPARFLAEQIGRVRVASQRDATAAVSADHLTHSTTLPVAG